MKWFAAVTHHLQCLTEQFKETLASLTHSNQNKRTVDLNGAKIYLIPSDRNGVVCHESIDSNNDTENLLGFESASFHLAGIGHHFAGAVFHSSRLP